VAHQDRRGEMSGIGIGHAIVLTVDNPEEHGDMTVELALEQFLIEPAQNLAGCAEHARTILAPQTARKVLQQHGDEGRRSTMARDIGNEEDEMSIRDAEVVDEVPGQEQ